MRLTDSLNKQVLSAYYVPGTILGSQDTAVNNREKNLEFVFFWVWEEQTDNTVSGKDKCSGETIK